MMYFPASAGCDDTGTSDSTTLSRLLVECTILLVAARTNPSVVLREAATISCSRYVNKILW